MNVLIVDDDPTVCRSLELLLSREADLTISGLAADGHAAIAYCETHLVDIILMDIRMPGLDGIQATRTIKQRWPHIRIMMLTTFEDQQSIQRALLAGAEGYLLKSLPVSGMAQQIRALHAGAAILDDTVLKQLTQPTAKLHEDLTARETDILKLIGQGYSNREIAEYLSISEGTVRNNVSVILDKLQLRDRTQLAIYYWRQTGQKAL
jgi:NarL family two-component system response regulator LiaR